MVNGHVGQGQPKAHDIGRWAHINVKLHFLSSVTFDWVFSGMSSWNCRQSEPGFDSEF